MATNASKTSQKTASSCSARLALLAALLLAGLALAQQPQANTQSTPDNLELTPLLDRPYSDFRAGFSFRPPLDSQLATRNPDPDQAAPPPILGDWDILQRPESRLLVRLARDAEPLDLAIYRLATRSAMPLADLLDAREAWWARNPAARTIQAVLHPQREPATARLAFTWAPPDLPPRHFAEGIVQAAPDRFFLLALALPPDTPSDDRHDRLLRLMLDSFEVLPPAELALRQRAARDAAATALQNLQLADLPEATSDRWFRLYYREKPAGFYRLTITPGPPQSPSQGLQLNLAAWFANSPAANAFLDAQGLLDQAPELAPPPNRGPASFVAAFTFAPGSETSHCLLQSDSAPPFRLQTRWQGPNLHLRRFQGHDPQPTLETLEVNQSIFLPHTLALLGHPAPSPGESLFLCYANRALRFHSIVSSDSPPPLPTAAQNLSPAPLPTPNAPATWCRCQTGPEGPIAQSWFDPQGQLLCQTLDSGLLILPANPETIRTDFPDPLAQLESTKITPDWPQPATPQPTSE